MTGRQRLQNSSLAVDVDLERAAFVAALVPLETVCRPALTEQQLLGYFAALRDLPPKVLFLAASKIAATRIYPTFPMPGEIRQVAAQILAGEPSPLFGEAWRLACEAAKRLSNVTDPAYKIIRAGVVMSPHEYNARILSNLPRVVAKTLRCFGADGLHDDEVVRAQFRRMYEEFVAADVAEQLVPEALANEIAAITPHEIAAATDRIQAIIGRIGISA